MKITNQAVDAVILRELGSRLARMRLESNYTQAALAEQSGVSKRTLERMEAGGSTQLVNLVRVCRALDLLDRFEALIPEPLVSPVAQLKLLDKRRQRATAKPSVTPTPTPRWEWGEKG